MTKEIIERLGLLAEKCIEYVGSANYRERELAAKAAMKRGIEAALTGDYNALMKVKIKSGECGQPGAPLPYILTAVHSHWNRRH